METLRSGFDFLAAQSGTSLLYIFWYTLIFEFPRYSLTFVSVALGAVAAGRLKSKRPVAAVEARSPQTLAVLVVGHNEAGSLERCIRSLREQTRVPDEIVIVSDGSSDAMAQVAARLVKNGLATRVLSSRNRGGKAGGINLAVRSTKCGIIAIVDCDCSFDRYAIANLIAPLSDPGVGGSCGDIVPRNGQASLVSGFQEIEYLMTISLAKRIGNALNQVVCLSGAFSAFRTEALQSVGSFDVGGGEDLDTTMRLRDHGWRVAFAQDAVCYTDVPTSLWLLVRQRLRWERDAVWIRFRKHWRLMSSGHSRFRASEVFNQWDFLLFNILGAAIFPIYTVWLFGMYGFFALPILLAIQVVMSGLDFCLLALAAILTGRPDTIRLAPLVPGFSFFNGYIMKSVRLLAYVQEVFLASSRKDNYVPERVRSVRSW